MRYRALVLALLVGGCNWGTRPLDFPPATGPQGARVAIRVRGESADRVGELLAVDSIGVTIRSNRVIRIAWTKLEAMDVDKVGNRYDVHRGESVDNEKIENLKLLSRFPQGIDKLPITLDSVIAQAQRETQRFGDRRVAVADGYHRIGADFPGMGEHWLNVRALLDNRLDPARPTLLTYADIGGRPTLLGVGFVVVTRGDSTPNVPGWPDDWHEHSGLLSEESGAVIGTPHNDSQTHVWVMHVWTSLENPSGQLSADNWSLPFLRAGIAPPTPFDADVGRAASLAVGGDEFLRGALADAELRTPANASAVDSVIAAARARAVTGLHDNPDTVVLRAVWADLTSSLEQVVGPGARSILAPPHHAQHRDRR